jgi:hypothetical protein
LVLSNKIKEKKEKNTSRGASRFVYPSPNTWNNITIEDESSERASRWRDIKKPCSVLFVKFGLIRELRRSNSRRNVSQFPTLATNNELPNSVYINTLRNINKASVFGFPFSDHNGTASVSSTHNYLGGKKTHSPPPPQFNEFTKIAKVIMCILCALQRHWIVPYNSRYVAIVATEQLQQH